ncbi:unnamed protein product [Cylicocyclus nassatus]|uniref:BPTI/Kunitz inhibitor domain-containing protein n=1 Tax=Cylicocyclus nassatus TaxID=53992 RepID=A0AA36HBG6_CYLNA|nr:unnamed protein product [Cylicocyclus nassatus]
MKVVILLLLLATTEFLMAAKRRSRKINNYKLPKLTKPSEWCKKPKAVGRCKAAFPGHYYDPQTRSCRPFVYGGCGGNENNFVNQEDCEMACLPAVKERCNCRGFLKPLNSSGKLITEGKYRTQHDRYVSRMRLCMEVCVYVKLTNWEIRKQE